MLVSFYKYISRAHHHSSLVARAFGAPRPPMASSGVLGRVASLPSRVSRPLVSLLRRSPRELSLVYLLKALDSYGYFALSEVFTLYLSDEFGVDDVTAGTYYGLWGTAITVYGVLTGFLVDALGVRRSLACSYALQFASRVALAWTRDVRIVLAVVFLVQPLGSAWGAPVMTIAIKRLTRPPDRTLGFGVFYAMMNVAALVSASPSTPSDWASRADSPARAKGWATPWRGPCALSSRAPPSPASSREPSRGTSENPQRNERGRGRGLGLGGGFGGDVPGARPVGAVGAEARHLARRLRRRRRRRLRASLPRIRGEEIFLLLLLLLLGLVALALSDVLAVPRHGSVHAQPETDFPAHGRDVSEVRRARVRVLGAFRLHLTPSTRRSSSSASRSSPP